MQKYCVAMEKYFFSGFYESPDLKLIEEEANKYELTYVSHKKTDLWVAAKFIKN